MDRIVAAIVRLMCAIAGFAAFVPTVAVSMDERLDNLASELGVGSGLLLHVDDADLAPRLLLALDYAHENRQAISSTVSSNVESSVSTLRDMGSWFADYVRSELSR